MAQKRTNVVKVHKNPGDRFLLVLLWRDKVTGEMCGGLFDEHDNIDDAMRGGDVLVAWGFESALVEQIVSDSTVPKKTWRRIAKGKGWKEVKKIIYKEVDSVPIDHTAKEAQ